MKGNTPAILAVAVIAAVAGYVLYTQQAATENPNQYAQQSLKSIAGQWDYETFTQYADESLETVVTKEKWQDMAAQYQRLGKLTGFGDCQTQRKEGKAKVDCNVSFEAAPAQYSLELIEGEKGWQTTSIYLISDLFREPAANAPQQQDKSVGEETNPTPAAAAPADTKQDATDAGTGETNSQQ